MSLDSVNQQPIVMSLSGLDPSGGAGIQADIETLASIGCHCTPIITALTAQDSSNVKDFQPVDSALLIEQARAVLEDMPVKVFKIGMIGSVANAEAIHTLLLDYKNIPVVLDPILKAGGGGELSEANLVDAINNLIMPYTTITTPNTEEARQLCSDADSLDACAQGIMDLQCQYVLLTGGHEASAAITNRLWHRRNLIKTYQWQRLEGQFHGTGCTLAAAIAGFLAHGSSVESAVREAQSFVMQTIQYARRLGMGQQLPNRFFWLDNANNSTT